MIETVVMIMIYAHVAFGFTALGTGVTAIIMKKGSKHHNRSGLLYFYAIMGVVLTSFVIAIVRENQFFFHLSFFVLYLTYSGYRSIQNKSLLPSKLDWAIWLIGGVNGLAMIYTMSAVMIVFGVITMLNVYQDVRLFYTAMKGEKLPKSAWLVRHVGMMMGSYIGTVTAFLVNNFTYGPAPWLLWLLPTAILVPVIFYWTNRVRKGKMELVG